MRDVGTVFDLSATGDRTRVVVAQGSVEVSRDDRRMLLTRGQAMTIGDGVMDEIEPVDAAAATAWSRGRLVLEDRSLAQVIAAVRPHYRGRILLLGGETARQRLSVAIDLDHIDNWLSGLAKTRKVRVTRVGGLTVLT